MSNENQKPDGYAIRYPDGSIAADSFYTEDDLDYTISKPFEEQARGKFLRDRFRREYNDVYKSDSAIHRVAMEKIERIYAGVKAVKVKLMAIEGEK